MSVAEREIKRPQIQPSINYFDTKIVGKNVKRWVFFPGDLIVPQRKADIEWLAPGGEETSSPCLQKYGRGFVPRGFAAMLELGGDLMPMEHLGELRASAWSGLSLNESNTANRFGYIPVYPGDGLAALVHYSRNGDGGRRGLDEDTALLGKEWEECHNGDGTGILDVIEGAMFGDGMEPTLRGLTDQIRYADISDSRIDIGKMKDDRVRMCDEFRLWATTKMSQEHSNLKLGTKGDWVYSYSPLAEMLLTQLEMTRQDQPLAEMSRLQSEMLRMVASKPEAVQSLSAADLEVIERRLEERLLKARESDAARIAELEAKLAAPVELVPVKFVCEDCNRVFDTSVGRATHRNLHCKGKPE